MDHLVIPLDSDHVHTLAELVEGVAAAAGLAPPPSSVQPHITLVAYSRLTRASASTAIEPVITGMDPFTIHAHGYGLFTGADSSDLSLHVPVVGGGPLDVLHRELCAALRHAGAEIAGWSEPEWWSPHITLLDRELDAARLGNAVTWLAGRHHPSWRIPVDRVALCGGWAERDRPCAALPFRIRRATSPVGGGSSHWWKVVT